MSAKNTNIRGGKGGNAQAAAASSSASKNPKKIV